MAASLVAIHGKTMDKKTLQIIFYLILTFNYITNKLSQNIKDIVPIKKKVSSNFSILAYVKPHYYDLDNNL